MKKYFCSIAALLVAGSLVCAAPFVAIAQTPNPTPNPGSPPATTAPHASPATNPSTSTDSPDNSQAVETSAKSAQAQSPDSSEPTNPAPENAEPADANAGSDQAGMFVFKKEVEEVILHATVFDDQRRIVADLDRGAFTVLENGKPQTVTSFRRQDVPVAMGIVVDNSGSMRDKRDALNSAVLNLIRASNSQDKTFVVNFTDQHYLDQDFTADVKLLESALHQTSAKGSTALYDAIVASAVHLEYNTRFDKKILLVITDGRDNMSQESLQEALHRVQQINGLTVYAVGLMGTGAQQGPGREALQRFAEATGGVAYFPESLDQVEDTTRKVAHDIRSQYLITYRPQDQNIKPDDRSVQVEAHAAGHSRLMVSTRSGQHFPGVSDR